ncbi:hypothetical protein ACLB2K_050551 [Fragaria x ananassa]
MIGTCTQTISRCQQKKAERRKRKRRRICTVALYPRVNEEGGLYSGVKHTTSAWKKTLIFLHRRRSYTGYGKMTKAPMFRKNRANDDIVMDSSVEVVVQILNTPVKTQTMKVYQRKNKSKVGHDIPVKTWAIRFYERKNREKVGRDTPAPVKTQTRFYERKNRRKVGRDTPAPVKTQTIRFYKRKNKEKPVDVDEKVEDYSDMNLDSIGLFGLNKQPVAEECDIEDQFANDFSAPRENREALAFNLMSSSSDTVIPKSGSIEGSFMPVPSQPESMSQYNLKNGELVDGKF